MRDLTARKAGFPAAGSGRLPAILKDRRWLALAVAAIAIGGALIGSRLAGDDAPAPAVATAAYTNQEGKYSLRYPVTWNATSMGSVTKLTTRSQDVVVGIGDAPTGKLAESSQAFTATILRAYRDVGIESRRQQRIGGRDAALVAGTAQNAGGVALRWLTITITERGKNYGISVFAGAGSDPATVLPQLNALVASFTPLS